MAYSYLNITDSIKVSKLFDSGVITNQNAFEELGLIVFHVHGHYCLKDKKRWMLGKIKYGI
jgi:hypothetical protein